MNSKNFRGLFIQRGTENRINFERMESQGVKQIITMDQPGLLTSNLPILKQQIETCLNRMNGTHLELYVLVRPFAGNGGLTVSPTNLGQMETVASKCGEIVGEYDIEGVVFDDFFYPQKYYDYHSETGQREVLKDYLNTTQTSIHDSNPKSHLVPCLNIIEGYYASYITDLSPYSDFIIPMIYRYDNQYFDNDWVKSVAKILKEETSPTPMVPALMTFKSDVTHEQRTASDLQEDMKNLLSLNLGYAMLAYEYMPQPMQFVDRTVRMFRNRIITNISLDNTPIPTIPYVEGNILPENVSKPCSDGTTAGFSKLKGSETLEVETDVIYEEPTSLKVSTPGNQKYEGVTINNIPIQPSGLYNSYIQIKLSPDASVRLLMVGNTGNVGVKYFTGKDDWQYIGANLRSIADVTVNLQVYAFPDAQEISFYLGQVYFGQKEVT